MKKAICILLSGILILCAGCRTSDIEGGFSDDIKQMLLEDYELVIPDSAVFEEGYYDNAFQDDCVYIRFSVSEQNFASMLSENWEQSDSTASVSDALQTLLGKPHTDVFTFHGEMFTFLIRSKAENGIITCAFQGRHPSKHFA